MTKTPNIPPGVDIPPCNKAGLEALGIQKDRYTIAFILLSGFGVIGFGLASYLLGLLLLTGSYSVAGKTAKSARIAIMLELLINEFEPIGMQAFPLVTTRDNTGHNYIDLYVRFPKGQLFIETRSVGNGALIYNEAKETLYLKRKKKGLSEIRPCPLLGLNDSKKWLAKNRHRFHLTSRQATKTPTVKVLVAWGETKISAHREQLYTKIGERKYLTLSKRSATTFVVTYEELATFIRDWLSRFE